eukprot:CAMPEP_0170823292 /NCGR_PEP_ID=MMETSP0733-20121128/44449_1 /TAXON_ID=186038 /ORGANISM="Fragilariopsis kerguelensis, Strain L26-C5" /LENGTH=62 /DNA_ID=CAMNT_0011185977 /DNA_START=250 /DNA_END=438 /DNA_ORIENTATION=+
MSCVWREQSHGVIPTEGNGKIEKDEKKITYHREAIIETIFQSNVLPSWTEPRSSFLAEPKGH